MCCPWFILRCSGADNNRTKRNSKQIQANASTCKMQSRTCWKHLETLAGCTSLSRTSLDRTLASLEILGMFPSDCYLANSRPNLVFVWFSSCSFGSFAVFVWSVDSSTHVSTGPTSAFWCCGRTGQPGTSKCELPKLDQVKPVTQTCSDGDNFKQKTNSQVCHSLSTALLKRNQIIMFLWTKGLHFQASQQF